MSVKLNKKKKVVISAICFVIGVLIIVLSVQIGLYVKNTAGGFDGIQKKLKATNSSAGTYELFSFEEMPGYVFVLNIGTKASFGQRYFCYEKKTFLNIDFDRYVFADSFNSESDDDLQYQCAGIELLKDYTDEDGKIEDIFMCYSANLDKIQTCKFTLEINGEYARTITRTIDPYDDFMFIIPGLGKAADDSVRTISKSEFYSNDGKLIATLDLK